MPATKKSPAKKSPAPIATGKTATKRTTRKAVPVAAPAWNTIHIFGYGESQVIGGKAMTRRCSLSNTNPSASQGKSGERRA